MDFNLDVITSNAVVIVPIVIALTQAIKLTGWIRDHYTPLVAIGIGVLIGWIGDHNNPDWSVSLLSGVVYGLMASGLYSGVKTTMVAHARMKAERWEKEKQKTHSHNRK